MVRVPLRGRRVRGWVVDADVVPEAPPERLQTILRVSSEGPPPDLIDLATWAAWRWAGPRAAFLRAATPPNNVAPGAATPRPRATKGPPRSHRPAADPEVESVARWAIEEPRGVVRWPPTTRLAELLRRLVAPDGSTVVVLPDPDRVRALATHLGRAGHAVVMFRGDDTAAGRSSAWVTARGGRCVAIGGRVALWAPVPDLAAVVVVDDADEALKDERAPAWHARELGIERARRAGCRLTVVSPAPTPEALTSASGVWTPSRLAERTGWCRSVVIDRREEPPGLGLFSPALALALRELRSGQRAVCVLNRKGRARLLRCAACRELVRCEACGTATAEDDAGLECAVCGTRRPRVCATCGSSNLRRLRLGIRRATEELRALLPRLTVAEVDAATPTIPDADVLVGTESVLHRVDRAACVAFLDLDQELVAPRFRAGEQALWLMVRAVRIAGAQGTVLLQTHLPDHPVVQAVASGDPGRSSDPEVALRRTLGLPPFGGLAAVEGDPPAVAVLEGALAQLGVEGLVVSTEAGPGSRARGIVRATSTDALCNALAAAAPVARGTGRLRIEVDPLRV